MNKKYFVCNLKANEIKENYEAYIQELNDIKEKELEIIVCPQTPYLYLFKNTNIKLGAQDVSKYNEGPYTGEVTARTLKNIGVEYVIVGHYERRLYFKEEDKDIIKKINNVLENDMKVIYTIGENYDDYKNNKTISVLESQIANVFNNVPYDKLERIIISYEPVWMIGNKKEINKEYIEEILNFIKTITKDYYDINTSIIYGGGVDENKIEKFKNIKNLDGFVVGSAILDIKKCKILLKRQF